MIELPTAHSIRHPTESDHWAIVDAIGRWWDTPNAGTLGRLLPRLFVQHFSGTSWIVESESGEIGAFLIGFRSQDDPEVAYIHFVGVDPELRGAGLGRGLYELFFEEMKAAGCTEVRAITGPSNRRSQDFHAAMGFTAHGDRDINGVLAYPDYDGPGEWRVVFERPL
jgi:ribosomal protein S18 acetylase RimI-like enzyme